MISSHGHFGNLDSPPPRHGRDISNRDVAYSDKYSLGSYLPYRSTGQRSIEFNRNSEKLTLVSTDSTKPLPYGRYPRLLLIYLTTQAVQRRHLPLDEARKIPVGETLTEFAKNLGITDSRLSGGKTGNLTRLREQLELMSYLVVRVESNTSDEIRGKQASLLSEWSFKRVDMPGHESYICLTPEIYKMLIDGPMPVDLRHVQGLTKPLAQDVYLWLTRQVWRANRQSRPLEISWRSIYDQFGRKETKEAPRKFRYRFQGLIDQIQEVWPDVRYTSSRDYLTLYPCDTPIPEYPKN